MIEKTILDYLNSRLDEPVYMEEPISPSGSYVIIEKTGGNIQEHISHSTLAIQSYAASMYGAASLNDRIIGEMINAIKLDEITDVELNSNYNFTDTETKKYRYQAVFDITHY